MTIHRRRWLKFSAAATAGAAVAQISPGRRLGRRGRSVLSCRCRREGAADIIARLFAARLERLGQPVIVDNKPGAGTTVGVQSVVTAAPDGHTLLVTTTASAIGATLYDKLPYNFQQDIAPVAGLVRFPLAMTANRSVPASTVAEFIAYARANPGKINMGSAGNGPIPRTWRARMFKTMTGDRLIHVPYRGEPPDAGRLIAGRSPGHFSAVTASITAPAQQARCARSA